MGRFGVSRPFDASASVGLRRGFQVSGGPEAILRQGAVLWLDALYSNAGQTATNLGTGGTALNATLGSTASADSNDPLWLANENQPYVYLPGVANNSLSAPDSAALDITGDIDLRVHLAADDWTPAANGGLLGKWDGGTTSYLMWINTSGAPVFYWADAAGVVSAEAATASVPFTDGNAGWVRVTFDVDNGASQRVLQFFTSTDGVTWTQLGSTITRAGTTSIRAGTALMKVGEVSGTRMAGKFYRAQVLNGIDGTVVFDANMSVLTSSTQTTFTESSSNAATVTVNRSTSGRKTVLVIRQPVWLFGTDDYMEIPDNANLDFGGSASFTVLAVIRQANNLVSFARIVSKESATAGWTMLNNAASRQYINITDGTNTQNTSTIAPAYTVLSMSLISSVVDLVGKSLIQGVNTTTATTTYTANVGSLENASVLRIGRQSNGTSYIDMELAAVAIFRRILTAAELQQIVTYYQTRYV